MFPRIQPFDDPSRGNELKARRAASRWTERTVPAKLADAGFRFRYPALDEALRDLTA